jgi:hypothetical protein
LSPQYQNKTPLDSDPLSTRQIRLILSRSLPSEPNESLNLNLSLRVSASTEHDLDARTNHSPKQLGISFPATKLPEVEFATRKGIVRDMGPGEAEVWPETQVLSRPASLQEEITIAEKEMICNMDNAQCLLCCQQHNFPCVSVEWKLTCIHLLYLVEELTAEPNIDNLVNLDKQLVATYECDTALHNNLPLQDINWFKNKFLPEINLLLGGISAHADRQISQRAYKTMSTVHALQQKKIRRRPGAHSQLIPPPAPKMPCNDNSLQKIQAGILLTCEELESELLCDSSTKVMVDHNVTQNRFFSAKLVSQQLDHDEDYKGYKDLDVTLRRIEHGEVALLSANVYSDKFCKVFCKCKLDGKYFFVMEKFQYTAAEYVMLHSDSKAMACSCLAPHIFRTLLKIPQDVQNLTCADSNEIIDFTLTQTNPAAGSYRPLKVGKNVSATNSQRIFKNPIARTVLAFLGSWKLHPRSLVFNECGDLMLAAIYNQNDLASLQPALGCG